MKKTLATLAVLFAAYSASAATLTWSITNILVPETTTGEKGAGYTAYLFITQQSDDFGSTVTTVDAVKNLIESGAEFYTETTGTGTEQVTKNYLKKGDDKIQIAGTGTSNNSGIINGNTGYYGAFDAGNSLTAFAVILDGATLPGASNYIVTSTKSASWTSATGSKSLGFGSQANATWTPVPEPSTAVLALAGLALLLKRRRA